MTLRSGIDRRNFLSLLGCGGCAMALGAAGCTIAEVFDTEGGELAFDVAEPQFSALAAVGGFVSVQIAGRPVILIRTTQDTIAALNRICTHTQCDMDPVTGDGRWDGEKLICTCHDSHFNAEGKVLQGPATRDLATYPVTFSTATGLGTVVVGGSVVDDNPIPEEYRDLTNPFEANDADAIAQGEQHYAACVGCHGDKGQGSDAFDPPASAFDGDNSAYADDYLFWRLRTGSESGPEGSVMPAYSEDRFSDEELWQVISYLRSLGQ